MRLARRASLAAFIMLALCAAALAQTQRSETDPRNQAPTVGTGGPPGGLTEMFTIYDGSTLRRSEFTFFEDSIVDNNVGPSALNPSGTSTYYDTTSYRKLSNSTVYNGKGGV